MPSNCKTSISAMIINESTETMIPAIASAVYFDLVIRAIMPTVTLAIITRKVSNFRNTARPDDAINAAGTIKNAPIPTAKAAMESPAPAVP